MKVTKIVVETSYDLIHVWKMRTMKITVISTR